MTWDEAGRLALRTLAAALAIVGVCGVVAGIGVLWQLRRHR